MKKRNIEGLSILTILALYLITIAFVPNLHLHINFSLVATFFFGYLGARSRNLFIVGLGLGFLSNYLQGLFDFPYLKWPMFFGIVLIGVVLEQLKKPKLSFKKGKTATYIDQTANTATAAHARTLFSDNNYYITSQQLDTVTADATFGGLTIDLRQAEFQTANPEIHLNVTFGSATLYIPRHWRVVKQATNILGDIKTDVPIVDNLVNPVTVVLTGNVTLGNVKIRY